MPGLSTAEERPHSPAGHRSQAGDGPASSSRGSYLGPTPSSSLAVGGCWHPRNPGTGMHLLCLCLRSLSPQGPGLNITCKDATST